MSMKKTWDEENNRWKIEFDNEGVLSQKEILISGDEKLKRKFFSEMKQVNKELLKMIERFLPLLASEDLSEKERQQIENELTELGVIVKKKDDLINITQTAGISDLIYNMRNIVKNGKKIEKFDYEKMEEQVSFVIVTKKGGEMELALTDMNGNKTPVITDSHKQLLLYMLWKDFESTTDRFVLKYDELFELKGVKDTDKNRIKIRQELRELDSIFFDYRVQNGKKVKWLKKVRLLAIWELDRYGITAELGTWKAAIPKQTFLQIHKDIFGYKTTRGIAGTTNLSFKLRDYKNISINESIKKQEKAMQEKGTKKKPVIPKKIIISVSKLLEVLEITEEYMKKQGVNITSDRFEKHMQEIEKKEDLQWQYRKGEWGNYKDFMSDYVEYNYKD